jgi:hypothetical protein
MAKKMTQGYNSRMDESLGSRNGKKKQSLKDRRDESKAMNKKTTGRAYSSVGTMDKPKRKSVSGLKKKPTTKPSRATRVASRKMNKMVKQVKKAASRGVKGGVKKAVRRTLRKR